jgi:hypothetical protein
MKVKVGGSILEMVEAQMDEYGRFSSEDQKIYLRANMKGLHRPRTELHEILHAIWHEYDLPREQEETAVLRLESGITGFIADNPDYARGLVSRLIKETTR